MHCFKSPLSLITILFLLVASVYGDGNGNENCSPCTQTPPPPPPPTPSPPPPPPSSSSSPLCPPPPGKSPPSPKKPPSPSTTPYGPPPPSNMIYITGPPGELYPVDHNFNGAARSSASALPIILVGLLSLLAFW